MSHLINGGIAVSTDNTNWYYITDENRNPIKISYEVIEKTNRMADGTLRRFVIARKHKIATDWKLTSSSSVITWDHAVLPNNYKGVGLAWLKSFYEANVFVPIYVKVISSGLSTDSANPTPFTPDPGTFLSAVNNSSVYTVFMTSFTYDVEKRSNTQDLVTANIEFTEI